MSQYNRRLLTSRWAILIYQPLKPQFGSCFCNGLQLWIYQTCVHYLFQHSTSSSKTFFGLGLVLFPLRVGTLGPNTLSVISMSFSVTSHLFIKFCLNKLLNSITNESSSWWCNQRVFFARMYLDAFTCVVSEEYYHFAPIVTIYHTCFDWDAFRAHTTFRRDPHIQCRIPNWACNAYVDFCDRMQHQLDSMSVLGIKSRWTICWLTRNVGARDEPFYKHCHNLWFFYGALRILCYHRVQYLIFFVVVSWREWCIILVKYKWWGWLGCRAYLQCDFLSHLTMNNGGRECKDTLIIFGMEIASVVFYVLLDWQECCP